MSFRQYGGINYAARNNIVKNNYTNANNLSVMTKVGQPSSIINVESGLYGIAGDITFQQLGGVPKYGITFSDGSFQNSALTSTDSYWVEYLPPTSPATIYYTGRAIVGADPYVTGGSIGSDVRLAINGGTAMRGNLYVANGDSTNAGVIYVTDNSNNTLSEATLKIVADRNSGANYIQSGVNNTTGSVADLYFTGMNATGTIWMTIKNNGKVGIGTSSPGKILDVNGDALINGLTVGKGAGNLSGNTVFGVNALSLNTSGNNNTAIGSDAGKNNTTTSNNTYIGYQANCSGNISNSTAIGYNSVITANNQIMMGTASETVYIPGKLTVVSGALINGLTVGKGAGNLSGNTVFGVNALSLNTSGNNNTAIGSDAGKNNTTTSNNTYIGYQANCSGNISYSTAIGYNSIITANNQIMMGTASETVYIPGKLTVVYDASINGLTVGKGSGSISSNTAVGYNSLQANTNGYYNTAVGYASLQANTSGYNNTAVGYTSMRNNTASSQNTSLGMYALFTQTNSGKSNGNGGWQNYFGDNTAIGVSALYFNNGDGYDPSGNLSGAWNTAVGLNALYHNTTGYYNTAIGLQAGVYFNSSEPNGGGTRTANKCTFLGAESRSTYSNPSQSTAIGYDSVITANNQIMMGTASETVKIPGVLHLNSVSIPATSATYTISSPYSNFYIVDTSNASGMTITLPDPGTINKGFFLTFRRKNRDHSIILKTSTGSYMVGYTSFTGAASVTMGIDPSVITSTFFSDGSFWWCTNWIIAY